MNVASVVAQMYWKQDNPLEDYIVFVVIGIVFLVLIVAYAVKSQDKRKKSLLAGGWAHVSFAKAARARGIPEDDVHFLDNLARAIGTANPEFVFQNTQRLDSFFRDSFRYIEKHSESESVAEERKTRLFMIRESITQRALMGPHVTSTRQIERHTTLSFITPDNANHPSVVLAVEPGGIAVEPVLDAYGERVNLGRGTRLTVFFYRKAHQGYSFPSRVLGYENVNGKLVMVIKHSDTVSALPTRRNLRRDMNAPCTFQRVRVDVVKTRGAVTKNVVVEQLPYRGTIVDISAGGCSIRTGSPQGAGTYVKVDFEAGTNDQSAIGAVVRSNQTKGGGVMHIRFVKITRKAVNAILSYVYGYSE